MTDHVWFVFLRKNIMTVDLFIKDFYFAKVLIFLDSDQFIQKFCKFIDFFLICKKLNLWFTCTHKSMKISINEKIRIYSFRNSQHLYI